MLHELQGDRGGEVGVAVVVIVLNLTSEFCGENCPGSCFEQQQEFVGERMLVPVILMDPCICSSFAITTQTH